MRLFDFLRAAVGAVSLVSTLSNAGTAFADTLASAQTRHIQPQPTGTSPYDNPSFVIDESNIFS